MEKALAMHKMYVDLIQIYTKSDAAETMQEYLTNTLDKDKDFCKAVQGMIENESEHPGNKRKDLIDWRAISFS